MTSPTDRDREADGFDPPTGALSALLDDVRPSRPRIDWTRVESKLFDQHGNVRESAVRESARRSFTGPVAALLAMAAAFAVALTSPSRPVEPRAPKVAAVRAPIVQVDGGASHAVRVGDSIVASKDGGWLESSGRLKARLSPGTRVRVLDDGERIQLALLDGAIAAEVVPVSGGEPFAVDVDGRRVAVHGTKLQVALLAGNVEVAVSEGSAVVGFPRGEGRTEGPIVAGGAIGHFSSTDTLDVVHAPAEARELVEGALAAKPSSAAIKPSATTIAALDQPSHPDTKKPGSLSNLGVGPSITVTPSATMTAEPIVAPPPAAKALNDEEIGPTFGRIRAALTKCIPAGPESTPIFSTSLTLSIQPSGVVEPGASFSPEIDSKYRECARKAVYNSGLFPVTAGKTTVTKPVILGGK